MNQTQIEMNEKKSKKSRFLIVLAVLLLCLSIGYAILSTNVNINGTSSISNSTWDIHFENLQVSPGSVALSTGDVGAAISNADRTTVTYTVTLVKPGDFYEFTVDVKNGGTVDGMVSGVTSKMNGVAITSLPNYLNYSVTYSDGKTIANDHLLSAGAKETYKVRLEYKKEVQADDLPAVDDHLTFEVQVDFAQATENAIDRLAARYVFRNNTIAVDAGALLSEIGTYYNTYQALNTATPTKIFLRHKLEGNQIVESSTGFIYNGNTYYLVGGGVTYDSGTDTYSDSIYYNTNKETLLTAFGETNCTEYSDYIECSAGEISAVAGLDGAVDVYQGSALCDVDPFESSFCQNS